MEECLFGPDRVCPPDVLEAVLSGDDEFLSSPTKMPSSLPTSPARSTGSSGSRLDDLDVGRWQDAKKSPEKSNPQSHIISLQVLRRLSSQGIEDKGSHRGVCWRILLGYLPPDTSQWKSTLLQQRQLYRSLVSELFQCSTELFKGNDLRGHHGKRRAAAAQKRKEKEAQARNSATKRLDYKEEKSKKEPPLDSNGTSTANQSSVVLREEAPTGTDTPPLLRRSRSEVLLIDHSPTTATEALEEQSSRRRCNSIGGTVPDEVGLAERRLDLQHVESQNEAFESSDPITAASSSINRYEEDMVPARIREEYKRSGRDMSSALAMTGQPGVGVNTLLVANHHHPSPSDSSPEKSEEEHDSKWYQFFENAGLLDEIRKDVVRTHPDLYFFLEPEQNLGQRRYAALERILFVWAKLNKGVRYVQGMNEIVGTLYYVLANDMNEEWACEAEADTYFLFNSLMIEMRDVFVPALDDADTGIQGRISNMSSLLALHDPEVRCHLEDCGIDASFYAIRWLTTLLSREFLLPDTIRLWDSMFASTHKDNFLRYVCVTMVMAIREDLLKGDFSTCLRLLQSYPPTNLDHLLESSRALWIYESQVTLACHKGGISLHQALSTISPPPAIVMAYGLKSGLAMSHPAYDDSAEATPNKTASTRDTLSASGRKLLQDAKGLWGRRSRTGSNESR